MDADKPVIERASLPAILTIAMVVGAALALMVVLCVPHAFGAVLEGQDSIDACRAGCDKADMIHVQKAALVQLLQEREQMKARINEVEQQAERAIKARDVALQGCTS